MPAVGRGAVGVAGTLRVPDVGAIELDAVGDSGVVLAFVEVVSGAVTGAGGGVDSADEDGAEVRRVIEGTVEKSPGLLRIINTTEAATNTAEANAITRASALVLRVSGVPSRSFTAIPDFVFLPRSSVCQNRFSQPTVIT